MLSRYHVPSLEKLEVTLRDIRTRYKELSHANNPKRTHQLDLLQRLMTNQENDSYECTLAALFYIEESIRSEYAYWPWPYNDPNRSALFRLTQQVLQVDTSHAEKLPVNDTIKCAYYVRLSQYLEKIKNQYPDINVDVESITKQSMTRIGTQLQIL